MSLISQLGSPSVIILFALMAILLFRLQAKPESRPAAAVAFIVVAHLGAPIIDGFQYSHETKTALGQLDTVFGYAFCGFAFLESVLIVDRAKWRQRDLIVLTGIFGLGFMNIAWKVFVLGSLLRNDFLFLISFAIIFSIRPRFQDLRFLPSVSLFMILINFWLAIVDYQNPYFTYTTSDYGITGPYHNFIWDIFGQSERFRGPYQHPNFLGIQIVFMGSTFLIHKSKLYLLTTPICLTILALASSRTSLLAITLGAITRLYFDTRRNNNPSRVNQGNQIKVGKRTRKIYLRNVLTFFSLIALSGVIIKTTISGNSTFSGRTTGYSLILSQIKTNSVFGAGPSLLMTNSVENSYLTLLSYYGLFGAMCLLSFVIGVAVINRRIDNQQRENFFTIGIVFLVASMGEALLVGSSTEIGSYYFLLLLSISRGSNEPRQNSKFET